MVATYAELHHHSQNSNDSHMGQHVITGEGEINEN